jgi:hypothetical protein
MCITSMSVTQFRVLLGMVRRQLTKSGDDFWHPLALLGFFPNEIIITKYLGLGIDSQSPKENRQHMSSAQFACCLGTFLH